MSVEQFIAGELAPVQEVMLRDADGYVTTFRRTNGEIWSVTSNEPGTEVEDIRQNDVIANVAHSLLHW
jgi:hypothetical protein